MKRQVSVDLAMTLAILSLGASLVFAGASLFQRHLKGIRLSGPLEFDGAVGAVAAGTGIAVAAWWLLALVCAFTSSIAQHQGAHGLASFTAAWSPAFMRRLVTAILGINLLTAPLAMAAPLDSAIDPQWTPATVSSATFNNSQSTILDPLPQPAPNLDSATINNSSAINPSWTPTSPAIDPDLLARPPSRPDNSRPDTTLPSNQPPTAGDQVVVHSGDSLWSIVASALGPYATDVEVALAWPEWYRTNKAVIGADPSYILPGQILHSPGN